MSFDLKTARLNEGLSQSQLAREVGLARETVRRVELGLGGRPSNLKLLADRFGVKVTDLLPKSKVSS